MSKKKERRSFPPFFKTAICDVCGKACVPMAEGDKYYDQSSGKYYNVIVCFHCDKHLGDMAYKKACEKKNH